LAFEGMLSWHLTFSFSPELKTAVPLFSMEA
jgi:hypothetical protein